MSALLTAIVTWLAINFGLPADYDHPSIEFMTEASLQQIHGNFRPDQSRTVVAVYREATGTIILPVTWTGRTPEELSILVHEMVHHIQYKAKLTYACPESREELAYAAQAKWLGMFGRDLTSAFGIDPLTLKVSTTCYWP